MLWYFFNKLIISDNLFNDKLWIIMRKRWTQGWTPQPEVQENFWNFLMDSSAIRFECISTSMKWSLDHYLDVPHWQRQSDWRCYWLLVCFWATSGIVTPLTLNALQLNCQKVIVTTDSSASFILPDITTNSCCLATMPKLLATAKSCIVSKLVQHTM